MTSVEVAVGSSGKGYRKKSHGKDYIYNHGQHITMKDIAIASGVKQSTIQEGVNLLRKYVVPKL